MAKYDWKQLEKEYILSDYKSVKEYLEEKGIKYNGNARDKTKGWAEKRVTKEEQKGNKIIEKIIQKEIEKEVDINTRHLNLYDKLLNVLEESFEHPEQYQYLGMPDFDKLKKMTDILDKAQKGQRLAKGLDKEETEKSSQSLADVIQKAYEEREK